MKILIAVDMEGITGVVHFDQTTPGHPEYERFRRLMTEDVNAAVRGAFAAGADEVIVSDGHWNATNILIEQLDPRARLNSGTPRPYSMIEGVDSGGRRRPLHRLPRPRGHAERGPRSHLVQRAGRRASG